MDIKADLVSQVKEDYLAYSMMVLVGRSIPNLYDGLKPAQRRVLTAMKWLGLKPDGRYMKSARVEGETMGRLHPHGGAYGVMVTMAAPWNNNIPLIDGFGNWGSSTDNPAHGRYTECKLSPFAWECLLSDSETWQLVPNYDGSLKEPTELNVKVPAVLLNGQEGIGVGFSCKIPSHNLRDICNAITNKKPLIPDFPTGCQIIRDEGLESYQKTGIGTMRLRATVERSTTDTGKKAKPVLTFRNLPAGTNPEQIGQQIKDGLDKGTILGVTQVRDDSDLSGDCLTLTAKANTDVDLLERQLFHYTNLESKYPARLLVVDRAKPVEISPSELITRWQAWRLDRLGVAFTFEQDAKESRLEIVLGYIKAIDKIDAVIKIIRAAKTPQEAREKLVTTRTLKFTPPQAQAILEMKLRALTNLDSQELTDEKTALKARLDELSTLIGDEKARERFMKAEIKAIGTRHGEKRRSEIIEPPTGLAISGEKRKTGAISVSKPRFLKIDKEKGLVTQAKGPRGALILEKTDKLVTVTGDGTLKKVASNFKGALGVSYASVFLAKREKEVKERKYLVIFTLDNQLKAMTVSGEDICKVTSKGKRIVPENATLIHFGEGSYEVPWTSSRKKKVELTLASTKQGRPGAKGIKVASLTDIQL